MRQPLFGHIRLGHFFLLLSILEMQMEQEILKTRTGMTFMGKKFKLFHGKSPVTPVTPKLAARTVSKKR